MSPAIPQENPKLEAQNTREELQKLRKNVELSATDPNRVQHIKDSAASLRISYETLRQKIETFKTTQPTHPDIPKYASILTAFEAVNIDGNPSMTEEEFFAAITDGLLAPDPANPALLQYEKLEMKHIADEEKALAAVMSIGAKFESAITGFVEKAQAKFGGTFDRLESFGISIGASDIARYLMDFVAGYLDGIQIGKLRPMRGLSKQLREYQGIMEARAKGITDSKMIQEGIAAWNTEYDKWMEQTKNDPRPALEPPPLADAIAFAASKAGFDAFPGKNALFGAPVELMAGSIPTAIRDAAGVWKISITGGCIEKNAAGYGLTAEGIKFREMFNAVKTEPAVTEMHRGSFAIDGGKMTAELDATMTVARLQRTLKILPRGNFSSVKLETDPARANFAAPLARFENGTLFVNKVTLDADATVNALAGTAAALGPDPKKLQWDVAVGAWNVT